MGDANRDDDEGAEDQNAKSNQDLERNKELCENAAGSGELSKGFELFLEVTAACQRWKMLDRSTRRERWRERSRDISLCLYSSNCFFPRFVFLSNLVCMSLTLASSPSVSRISESTLLRPLIKFNAQTVIPYDLRRGSIQKAVIDCSIDRLVDRLIDRELNGMRREKEEKGDRDRANSVCEPNGISNDTQTENGECNRRLDHWRHTKRGCEKLDCVMNVGSKKRERVQERDQEFKRETNFQNPHRDCGCTVPIVPCRFQKESCRCAGKDR